MSSFAPVLIYYAVIVAVTGHHLKVGVILTTIKAMISYTFKMHF